MIVDWDHWRKWTRKASFWMTYVLVFMVWTMFGAVAVHLVDTATEKMWMVIIFSGLGLTAELACFTRMMYCYWRAKRP